MTETTSPTIKGCYNCGTLIDTSSKYCAYCGFEQLVAGTMSNIQGDMSAKVVCPGCGEAVDRDDARFCPVCGHELVHEQKVQREMPKAMVQAPVLAPVIPAAPQKVAVAAAPAASQGSQALAYPQTPNWVTNSKGKRVNRIAAGVLGILLGSVGAHWFYIGKPALGVLSILTSWTGIPALVGFIHGIVYLTSTDEHFKTKYLP